MADGPKTPAATRQRTWRWVLFTFVLLLTMQVATPLYIVISQDLSAAFDWAGFVGFSLGSIAIPLAVGCIGLLWRKRRGLGFFLISFAIFLLLEAISIASVDLG